MTVTVIGDIAVRALHLPPAEPGAMVTIVNAGTSAVMVTCDGAKWIADNAPAAGTEQEAAFHKVVTGEPGYTLEDISHATAWAAGQRIQGKISGIVYEHWIKLFEERRGGSRYACDTTHNILA